MMVHLEMSKSKVLSSHKKQCSPRLSEPGKSLFVFPNWMYICIFVYFYFGAFVYCANPSFCPADKIVRPYRVYDLECQTLGFKKIYYWGNKIREASLFYFKFNIFEEKINNSKSFSSDNPCRNLMSSDF